jgi:poly(A) polymerase
VKTVSTEIEPLVKEQESRSRRSRQKANASHTPSAASHDFKSRNDSRAVVNKGEITADHPITKRRRVQRDLSKVIFGPTQ